MKKSICFILSIIFAFTGLIGCSKNSSAKESENSIHKIIGETILNGDLAEISNLNGIVKIDVITSGLDTYSFDTILVDFEKNKKLCEVSFNEGAWVSGLTENGFYVMNTLTKELKIYDRTGDITKERTFSEVSDPMYFCVLSEDEKYFAYANTSGTKVTVVNLSDNTKSDIDTAAPFRDALSFKNGILRAVSIEGEVFEIDVIHSSCYLSIADSRLNLFSAGYCLGETETNFLIINEDACQYVPISSANEIVVGIGENGFATTCVSQNKNQLRFYDLDKKSVSYYYTTEPVEKVCYMDEQNILAVTGSPMEKKHKIILCQSTSSEKITVLSQDVAVNTEPEQNHSQEITSTPNKLIDNVPVISQFPQYPTGCESVTAVMALHYAGKDISVEEFVDNFLPKSREFYIENGKHFGPSPYEYFIGNPKSSSSYGCMAPVIQTALHKCIEDPNRIKNLTDMSLNDICEQYIDNNIPVIMWATIHMLETNPKNSWYLSDGKRFTWPGNEHCMLLVGYDSKHYYFNDPYVGKLVAYEKSLTEDRFAELGRQAIAILPQ